MFSPIAYWLCTRTNTEANNRVSIPPFPGAQAHVSAVVLPGLWRRAGPPIGVPGVCAVRVGEVRVNRAGGRSGGMAVGEGKTNSAKRSQQLQLLSAVPPYRPTALPILDERLRGTKFVSLEPNSVLNSPQQTGVDFWSLNPYIGCEFGCTYCYARYAHRYTVERAHDAGKLTDEEFLEFRGPHGWEAFERRVFVKDTLFGALERDLRRYFRSTGPTTRPAAPIVIGTATDPYQPAERRFRLTRGILERLARCEGLNVGIITKSPLIARDTDVMMPTFKPSQRSEEHTSELQSRLHLVCPLLL